MAKADTATFQAIADKIKKLGVLFPEHPEVATVLNIAVSNIESLLDLQKSSERCYENLRTEAISVVQELVPRVERLRRILHRYGDRSPMATCHRADWQLEIDEAMEWVANNPEPPRDTLPGDKP